MALETGTRLGNYEILSAIGAGGMGEVYRARDTKLQRDVAIKILPEAFAEDPERMQRFEREARVVASLNHPNIATLYGFEEAADRVWLVLELVEGDTLEELLARGRTNGDDVVPIFEQIALGLESAHAAGVVHRDLKPANIKVRADGTVKVLDFGLAKALSEESDDGVEASQSPTRTKGTALGAIMGTAPYMSPEQARGKPVDKRTDIWAFGCCLYEVLSGRRPFAGQTVSDIIASILQSEPDFDLLPTETPPSLRRLLRRCLTKDSELRLHDIADARLELLDSGGPLPPAARAVPRSIAPLLVVTSIVAAIGGALAVGWWGSSRAPSPPSVIRASINLPPDTSYMTEFTPAVAISPDGRLVAYWVRRDDSTMIYVRRLDQSEGHPVPGTEDGKEPFFSPDGRWLGFRRGTELLKVSIAGGAPVVLADLLNTNSRGSHWGSDGWIVLSGGQGSGLSRVRDSGGAVEVLTEPDREAGEKAHRYPKILPSGDAVLFTIGTGAIDLWDDAAIAVLSLETREYRVVLEGGSNAHYSPTGHLIYGRHGELLAVPFDPNTSSVTGGPVSVLGGVVATPIAGNMEFDMAANGTLVYAAGDRGRARRVVWIDRNGSRESLIDDEQDFSSVDLSRDGRYLATWVGRANNSVWIYELERGTVIHRTRMFDTHDPVFSPDGEWVAFNSNLSGQFNIYMQRSDGSEPAERLTTSKNGQTVRSWTPDGELMAIEERRPDTGRDILLLDPNAGVEPHTYLRTEFDEWYPQISPDGRYLLYVSNETGRDEIYLDSFPEPRRRMQVSTDGGTRPRWNPSAEEILFRRGAEIISVPIARRPELAIGKATVLFGEPQIGARTFAVSADGERLALVVNTEPSEPITRLELVLNWHEELKRLVPTTR